MNSYEGKLLSRRRLMKVSLALGVGTSLGLVSAPALAQKSSKEAVRYRDQPKGDQQCSGCKFFLEPEGGSGAGACEVVEGEISPNGWCTLYAPKG